ncbi:MAG TPA: fumarylacetoacetate hydrolase [Verrucomicrobia bacterium]|nr:fumarylacetoacetate hydrolase [Verrucomicrobiota bacterium]HOP97388.1 fumarylacetoacetate hydrolase family protein [Verrucomicrobiota bacterium]
MKLCRYRDNQDIVRVGCIADGTNVIDLSSAGVSSMTPLLETGDPPAAVRSLLNDNLPRVPLSEARLCAPVEQQEVWAAGVTYLRSKTARMEESTFSANAYDRVYEAERPELFFKSLPEKVVGPGGPVGIRRDAKWNVPEPELALVLNSRGAIVGCTVGNDMSSRDIEGENLLYLPQAKIYHRSCALGPWIALEAHEETLRQWTVQLSIQRAGQTVFSGETSVGRIKRRFSELADFLFRCQELPHGAVLLTGTGVVPSDDFTLQENDLVRIEISGIGVLENQVTIV